MRQVVMAIPKLEIVEVKGSVDLKKFTPSVADLDDVPYISAYFKGKCELFVTENRKLAQMEIKERVNFKRPGEFLKML